MQTRAPKNPKKFRGTRGQPEGAPVGSQKEATEQAETPSNTQKGASPAAPYSAGRAHPSSVKNQAEAYASS